MSDLIKYAILDTDFVSKANIIKTDDRVLADEVLAFPEYRFYCHHKMTEELDDHGTNEAKAWLQAKIKSGEIICYDDRRIMEELWEETGIHCFFYYQSYLKNGCGMVGDDFYASYFTSLDGWLDSGKTDMDEFLSLLQSCEVEVGHQKSYGEVKAFVLLQAIRFLYANKVFMFCSDDRLARQGFVNKALVPCISILSVFLKLWLMGKPYDEVQLFFQSFVDWCLNRKNPQTVVKLWVFKDGSYKREGVRMENVLADIYAGKYEARKDGDLQLKRHTLPRKPLRSWTNKNESEI